MHRDSTGVVQRIEPGAVNWMSAGRGIVHSERTPKDLIDKPHRSHGLQLWIALPEALEDVGAVVPARARRAHPARAHRRRDRARRRRHARSARPRRSRPRRRRWRWSSISTSPAAASVALARRRRERARALRDRPSDRGRRRQGRRVHDGRARARTRRRRLAAPRGGRVVLVGGESLGHRFVSWNFVASSARADPRRRGRLAGSALRRRCRARPSSSRFPNGRRR